jgi:hypothetical protein
LVLTLPVLLALALVVPTGAVAGAGLQGTPTVDPGRGTTTPGTATATRAAGTTTAAPTRTPTPSPTPRRGTLSVAPTSGAAGTAFAVTGAGFSPNALLAVGVEGPNNVTAAYTQPSVGADGNFTVRVNSAGFAPGQYTVTVLALPNTNALGQATFTVTGMPAMPGAGGGGGVGRPVWPQALLAGATIVALLSLAGVAVRRRAA